MEVNVTERLTEKAIGELVDQFYVKVRADAELGPVFDRAISDWGPHLATMRNFWSSVMLTSGRYKGNPVIAHARQKRIVPAHFERWLALFRETCGEIFSPEAAAAIVMRAENIGKSLQLALFYRPSRTFPLPS